MKLERVLEAMKEQTPLVLFHLLYGALGDEARLAARLPLHVDAHHLRGDHRAAPVVPDRPVVHRAAQVASDRRADPRRRPGDAQEEGRHADDGRLADPVLPRGVDAAVVRPPQPVRVARAARSRSRSARSASPTTTRSSSKKNKEGLPRQAAPAARVRDSPAERWRTCSIRTRCPSDVRLHVQLPFTNFYEQASACPRGLYAVFGAFVVVGTANAVNLTDGLDGLAIGPSIMNAGMFLCSRTSPASRRRSSARKARSRSRSTSTSRTSKVPRSSPCSAAALFGAGIGFLWYNAYPAQVFMGDVGALGIGGCDRHARRADEERARAAHRRRSVRRRGAVGDHPDQRVQGDQACRERQVVGKRVFAMAPIHHHYEKMGWDEPKIIVRFWLDLRAARAGRAGHAEDAVTYGPRRQEGRRRRPRADRRRGREVLRASAARGDRHRRQTRRQARRSDEASSTACRCTLAARRPRSRDVHVARRSRRDVARRADAARDDAPRAPPASR